MKEIIEEYKNIIKLCLILIVVVIILFIIQLLTGKRVNHKVMEGEDFVYTEDTYTSGTGKTSMLPVINLDFENIEEYNKNIKKVYESSIKLDENTTTYNYSVHKNYLFLLIKYNYYDENSKGLETTYCSFNIDLKTGRLLQNKEVLKKYGYTEKEVANTVKTNLKKYYDKGVKKEYIDPNICDFECFLINHEINPSHFAGGVSLFYDNDELVIYRPFSIGSILDDKNIFEVDSFRMKIKKES